MSFQIYRSMLLLPCPWGPLAMWLYNTGSCPLSSAWNVSLVRLPLGHVVVCAAGGLLWRRQGATLSAVLAAKLTRPP